MKMKVLARLNGRVLVDGNFELMDVLELLDKELVEMKNKKDKEGV